MSDFILKIFPVDEVSVDKTELIKEHFTKLNFLTGEESEYYGESYFKPGLSFCDFFEFEDEISARKGFRDEARIKIIADGYGVKMDEEVEEPEFIDRKNVIEIWNIDGNYKNWQKLVDSLTLVTGDIYTGEWEIL
jgi:hypothetical protein